MKRRRIKRAKTEPVKEKTINTVKKKKINYQKRWVEILEKIKDIDNAVCAEVGVFKGYTAEMILQSKTDLTWYMIDPWGQEEPDRSYIESGAEDAFLPTEDMEKIYEKVANMADGYRDRAIIMRGKSVDIADSFDTRTLDLVFIDGDHSYDGAKRDINAWYSKVKSGGWIGGHDYQHERFPGVTQAVNERFGDRVETGRDRTWFVKKY